MKHLTSLLLLLSLSPLCLFAGDGPQLKSAAKPRDIKWSHEADTEIGYTATSDLKQGDAKVGQFASVNSSASYVATGKFEKDFLGRFGVGWNRYSFGINNALRVPNTLQSVSLTTGFDFSVGDKWLFRFEAQPGIYGDFDEVNSNQFNVPLIFGGTYFVNEKFQLFFGVFVDFFGNPYYGLGIKDDFPVFPAVGFRWQITDDLVFMALPPKPRLTYSITDTLSIYGGGQLLGGSFRTSPNFGNNTGDPRLNDSLVDYSEIRGGVGLGWNVTP
ncbi:MAG: hypothetical protein SFY92_08440, partial [Verrucomicrobiae bacterium]|nr:hypothetical protein [Verrucomicrobiae bacterium]